MDLSNLYDVNFMVDLYSGKGDIRQKSNDFAIVSLFIATISLLVASLSHPEYKSTIKLTSYKFLSIGHVYSYYFVIFNVHSNIYTLARQKCCARI
jgi:hypothetical protein